MFFGQRAGVVTPRMLELVPLNRTEQSAEEQANGPPLLTVEQLETLLTALRVPGCTLDELDLSYNRLGAEHVSAVTAGLPRDFNTGDAATATATPSSRLRKLNLRFNGFGDAGVAPITTSLFGGEPIAGVEQRAVACITVLDISFNGIATGGTAALAVALAAPDCRLRELVMTANRCGVDGAEALAEALRSNTQLTALNISVNDIGDEGAWELSDALEENEALEVLHLDGNGITAGGLEFFPSMLRKNSALKHVSLGMNKLGDDGAKAVATMLTAAGAPGCSLEDTNGHDCMLERLDLPQNGMGDVGAEALAVAMGGNRKLRHLNLKSNFISGTQASWMHTLAARAMPGVERIDTSLQKSRNKPRGAPKKLSKQEAAKKAEEERAKEREAYRNRG